MDNLDPTKNKIGESFESYLPEEQLPDFIWDNIVGELDAHATLSTTELANNKIKKSFENQFDDELPSNVWGNIENQLEIETVWKRVEKSLQQQTRKRYWREKTAQFSLVLLALLWLRSCEIGILPVQQKMIFTFDETTNPTSKSNSLDQNNKQSLFDKNNTNQHPTCSSITPLSTQKAKNKIVEKIQQSTTTNVCSKLPLDFEKSKTNVSSSVVSTKIYTKYQAFTTSLSDELVLDEPIRVENNTINNSNNNLKIADKEAIETLNRKEQTVLNEPNIQETIPFVNTSFAENSFVENYKAVNKIYVVNHLAIIVDTNIQNNLDEFVIKKATSKKVLHLRFELGLVGKVGTSILLGNATHQALDATSMVKTQVRPDGLVGVQFNCFLTNNDAITLVAAPYSSHQQYFGGYSQEGRFYHKEIKLNYFDFSLGYQRVLLRYNDFGNIPSNIYTRVDYGLGYLNSSQETINGTTEEVNNSYNNINHQIGLAIGNSHQIRRLVIDYGVYANMGLSTVQEGSELDKLANFGAYLGLRYRL